MSVANSTAFLVYGQAARVRFSVYSALTGIPVSIGSTSNLLITFSKDDGATYNPAGGQVGLSPTQGVFYIDLSASDMTCYSLMIQTDCSVSSSFCETVEIVPLRLTEQSGAALDQTIILFEQVVLDIMAAAINSGDFTGSLQQVNMRNGALKFQGSYSANSGTSTRNNLA
jgi:hypothetical protein